MTLIEFVLANVDFTAYYKTKFPQWNGDHNSNVSCPFSNKHATGTDDRPSFSLNINGKGGCSCHSCGKKIGSIIHFEKETASTKEKVDDETAASRIYSEHVRPVMASPRDATTNILPWQISLKGAPKIFGTLQKEIAISKETSERFNLGWESKLRRVAIPIFDVYNQLLNVRFYRLPSMRENEDFPKFLNQEGYGSPAALFPAQQLFSLCSSAHRPPVVYWMTGERDTLKAWDDGVPAFCYTTGENVCRPEWIKEIEALHCIIGVVQDNDEPGRKAAKKRMDMLEKAGIDCFLIELEGDKIKDYWDFRNAKGSVKDFLSYRIVPKSKSKEKSEEGEVEAEGETSPYYAIPRIFDPSKQSNKGEFQVSDIGHKPELYNQPITVKAIVSGKLPKTYAVPYIFRMGGNLYQLPVCREMVQLVRRGDEDIRKLIAHWLNTKAKIDIVEHLTVTEVEIIPMIRPGIESIYVNQRCYYFGSVIECNKPYLMNVIPTTDMGTQETIGLISHIIPVSDILDSYKFEESSYALLRDEFQPEKGSDVYTALRELAHSVAENQTKIDNREDLHLAALLTWVSPLQFEFPNEGTQRGWLNTLVVGDTETGKSKVCQKLTGLFNCGVFINAESCSYVGLVGGLVKSSSGMNLLRWGKIPLYNRQLVVVEELSGLSTQEISYMSELRSSGVARYDKGGLTGETSAKTRLLCLSNVRGEGRNLADYNTGVQAAQALVGQHEDLARFDVILTAIDDEVDAGIINRDRTQEEFKSFTEIESRAFRELIMFAWSLKVDQIEFTVGAYRSCLVETLKLCSFYHPSLPVFKAGSGRLKLARIALAIACLQFSWDSTKEKLMVLDIHVAAAAKLLDHFYRKPSFGYARYSHVQNQLQKVIHEPEVLSKIKETFKEKVDDFFIFVSYSRGFTKWDIGEAMGTHAMYSERIISQMFLSNLLKKGDGKSEWVLSKAGRRWIEKKLNGRGIGDFVI